MSGESGIAPSHTLVAFSYYVGRDEHVHGMHRDYLTALSGHVYSEDLIYGYMFGGDSVATGALSAVFDR
jgi:hypothetical protein